MFDPQDQNAPPTGLDAAIAIANGEDPQSSPMQEASQQERALLTALADNVKTPTWLINRFRNMQNERTYVSEDCMLRNSPDTVAVNHILRNQIISLAYLGVADPQPFCQPERRVGKNVSFSTELFAETMEIHLAQQAAHMRLGPKIEGAAQDASTNGIAILKVTIQSDLERDPLGESRFGDMQVQMAEYRRLVDANPHESSAEYQRKQDLEKTLRLFVAGKLEEQIKSIVRMIPGPVPVTDPMTGTPIIDPMTGAPVTQMGLVPDPMDPREQQRLAIIEGKPYDLYGSPVLPHYMGFQCDQILPEDFRWSWNVTRFEDLADADWLAHRVYMTKEDISRRWKVPKEKIPASNAENRSGNAVNTTTSDQNPALRTDVETTQVNDRVAVWEYWSKVDNRRYVFIEGMDRLLENEIVQLAGSRFYPFFPIGFNRVTGAVLPISDVQLSRSLQDEINMFRSYDREYKRAALPVVFVDPTALDPTAEELYKNRRPFAVIKIQHPDDIKKAFSESTTVPYNPNLTSTADAESQMAGIFGIPQVVAGQNSGEDLASAIALAKEGMETGVNRRRIQVNRVITDIFQYMAQISVKMFGEDTIRKRVGVGAVWPRLSTDELFTYLQIEVKGGYSGQPRSKDRVDLMSSFASICQQLQLPLNGVAVLRELLDAMGIRVDVKRFLAPVPLPGTIPQAPPPGPAQDPNAQGNRGAEGGAPLMVDRGAPSDLSQIPNNPLAGNA